MGKQKKDWRRLDNSAKLFPIISNKKFSNVFRLSVVLNEDIDKSVLEVATDNTLNIFTEYKVSLKRGFFWYYLEKNEKKVVIKEEDNYPCKYIDKRNNGYLFQITYYKNKINLEIFHSLTDGGNGVEFLKQLIYEYLCIIHKDELDKVLPSDDILSQNVEDEYIKNYEDSDYKGVRNKRAYQIKGNVLPLFATGVHHYFIEIDKFKKLSKENNATITEYLAASLVYSIIKSKKKWDKSKKNIKICIPVNLRNYFETKSITNFFSYITIEVRQDKIDFNNILLMVKEEFKNKLKEDEIKRIMSSNIKLGNNLFIKIIPLFFKKVSLKISYIEIGKYATTTISNIGRIDILPEFKKYIKSFLLLLAPERGEKLKCAVCSYENELVVTFTSILEDTSVQEEFKKHLEENNINVKVESNEVYNEFISEDI